MLPGARDSEGRLFVTTAAPAATDPYVAGLRLTPIGELYVTGLNQAWSPAQLFANGEQGAWYDPSDLTTLFQDAAGTTPVTADGQPVGLVLDKSNGGSFGANLIASPDAYSMAPEGSTPPIVSEAMQGGELCIKIATNVSGAQSYATTRAVGEDTTAVTQENTLQKMALRIFLSRALVGTESVTFYEQDTQGPVYTCSSSFPSNQWVDISATGLRLTTSASNIAIYLGGEFTGGALDIYVRQVSITDFVGNHASQETSTARPIYRTDGTYHWLEFDGIDDLLKSSAFSMPQPLTYTLGEMAISWVTNKYWYDGITIDKVMLYQVGGSPQAKPYAGVFPLGSLNIPIGSPCVVSNIYNGASSISRLNAVQVLAETFGTLGTDGITIGSNGAGTGNINANVYSLIARGALSTPQEITDTETWVNSKTGAY